MKNFIVRNSPVILTSLAVGGVAGTAILAAAATPEAVRHVEQKCPPHDATKFEIFKAVWRLYVPAAVLGGVTIASIIGLNSTHNARNAAIAGAYSLADRALSEHKAKAIELFGKRAQEIEDGIQQDRLDRDPVPDAVFNTKRGNTLCYDMLSGRYFLSDMEELRRALNEVNQQLLNDTWVSLNYMYRELGLEEIKLGDDLGWLSGNLIEQRITTRLADNGEPCIVLDYVVDPKEDYYRSIH